MKEIICNISEYTYLHPIYMADEKGDICIGQASVDDLSETIFKYAAANEVFDIHLFGNEEYLRPLVDDLATKFGVNYSNKNFNILVN